MSSYQVAYRAFGLDDSSKRIIRNPFIKDYVEFTRYGVETEGEKFTIRCLVQPSGGAPAHRHASYDETLKCVSGKMGVQTGLGAAAKEHILGPGEEVFVERHQWHRFFNQSDIEEFVFDGTVSPAHHGFEMALHIVYGLSEDGLVGKDGLPKSFVANCLFLSMGELEFPGWGLWLLSKVAIAVDYWAQWTGEKKRLIERYYGNPVEVKTGKEL